MVGELCTTASMLRQAFATYTCIYFLQKLFSRKVSEPQADFSSCIISKAMCGFFMDSKGLQERAQQL